MPLAKAKGIFVFYQPKSPVFPELLSSEEELPLWLSEFSGTEEGSE